jgi:hypothetical protein
LQIEEERTLTVQQKKKDSRVFALFIVGKMLQGKNEQRHKLHQLKMLHFHNVLYPLHGELGDKLQTSYEHKNKNIL